MSALLRYQAGILFRSHRWIFPLILYVLLISVGGVGGTEPLGDGLTGARPCCCRRSRC
jgi:hypothetical protein